MALIKRDRENFWMLNWLDEYMTGHKGFICGGCFKNIFNKEKVKDLDIFFENKSDFDDAVQYFDSQTPGYDGDDVRDEKYHFHYENDNVKAYKHIETGVVIELCCKIFGKPEEILNKFDFTITKFAYYKEEVEDETGAVAKRQAEIAWTSYNLPAKLFRYSNTGGTNSEKRIHPTQKPIALYEYLVGAFKLSGGGGT